MFSRYFFFFILGLLLHNASLFQTWIVQVTWSTSRIYIWCNSVHVQCDCFDRNTKRKRQCQFYLLKPPPPPPTTTTIKFFRNKSSSWLYPLPSATRFHPTPHPTLPLRVITPPPPPDPPTIPSRLCHYHAFCLIQLSETQSTIEGIYAKAKVTDPKSGEKLALEPGQCSGFYHVMLIIIKVVIKYLIVMPTTFFQAPAKTKTDNNNNNGNL